MPAVNMCALDGPQGHQEWSQGCMGWDRPQTLQLGHGTTSGDAGLPIFEQDSPFGGLKRKAPLVKRRTRFDSAEYFMAKEAGVSPLPVCPARADASPRHPAQPQPSRLRMVSY